ncbi:MAG TPA: mechanosensitive ion channel family protein [Methylomusa anaerophila]|uniref:Small-conductance mechanosensitive channel n=1 Tax=Methylomusa anaerophila TaxID=1930071 RepID=A0A348AH08_9FIRM|nr:mechanosensitive ion channel family protein [Methylomusa anaerophila]BBB90356.1 small-conductance mechanosensitive channel [Methylomusa anaerophila]HML89298.1 mechanosensitive ion channel family protein [Methylomusa anaerophila]
MYAGWSEMAKLWYQIKYLALPLLFILVAFAIGLAVNRMVFGRLKHIVSQSPGSLSELFIKSLHGIPVFWVTMIGIYAAINTVPLGPNLLGLMEKALLVLVLFSLTMVCARTVVGLVAINAQKAAGVFPSTSIFINVAEFVTYAIGLLIILQSIGISVTPILTALGVGGVAVALALQDTLSNLFSGLHILLSKKLRPGDYIRISSGEEGVVEDITWRDTTLRNLGNHVIVVPNSKIASAIIANYALPDKEIGLIIPAGVSYDSDLDHVETVTREVAAQVMREVDGGIPEYEPVVRFSGFGDSNINFNIIIRAREYTDQFILRHELVRRLHMRYRDEGIVISYPVRNIYLADGEKEPTDMEKEPI